MELDFTPEQRQIKDTVRRFMDEQCPPSRVRKMHEDGVALARTVWRDMADLGLLGLPFDESVGGHQCDWVTLAAVVEELGRACDPTPFVDCVLACGWLIQDIGTDVQKRRWLPPLIRGQLMLSLASQSARGGQGVEDSLTELRESADGFLLNGEKCFVENAGDGDYLVVPAGVADTSEGCVVLVSPDAAGVELTRLRSLAHPNLYAVEFRDVDVPRDQVLGRGRGLPVLLEKARDRVAAFQSVAATGGARRVLEMALDHARQREQFGKPIGSFQAVQHMLADVWSKVETSWLASYEAITYLEADLPAADKVAVAKCASSDAFLQACFTAHQVLGGMGYMWETDLHVWTRKAKAIEMANGGVYAYRRRLGAML